LVAGELAVDLTNKRLYTEDSGGTVLELGTNPSGNVTFGDNGKAIFGAGSDLQIYHDGTSSTSYFIESNATGNMEFRASSLRLKEGDGGNYYFLGVAGGASTVYHNGSAKLATTATGIDVTGTVTADGLSANGDITLDRSGVQKRGIKWNRSGTIDAAINLDSDEIVKFDNFYNGRYQFRSGASGSEVLRLDIATGGDISFYEDTGTTPKFFWDASAERLGIGTITPNAPVDSQLSGSGGLPVSSGTAQTYGSLRVGATSFNTILDMGSAGASGAWLQASDKTALGTNYSLLLNPNGGKVGIGTSSPSAELSVSNSGAEGYEVSPATVIGNTIRQLAFNRSTSAYMPIRTQASEHQFYASSSEAMRIDASGALLLNPNNATRGLKITTTQGEALGSDTTYDTIGAGYGKHIFKTDGAERMRLDASGNLLVGTTSNYGVSTMTLEYNSVSKFGLTLRDSGTSATAAMIQFHKDGNVVGVINSTTTATSYVTSSDQRLKENIADADDAGSKIDAIQVRKFDWKADGAHQDYGMVAQELQVVMMGVDYSKLVPMMLKEIQSLRARIAALES